MSPPPAPESDYLKTLLPLITAGFGALIGYLIRAFESRKAEVLTRIEDAVAEISAIQLVAGQYWSRNTVDIKNESEDLLQEVEIVGRLHSLNLLVEDLATFLHSSHMAVVRSLITELRQGISGGDFAAPGGHRALPSPLAIAFRTCAHLTLELRRAGRRYNRKLWRVDRS